MGLRAAGDCCRWQLAGGDDWAGGLNLDEEMALEELAPSEPATVERGDEIEGGDEELEGEEAAEW